MSIKKLLTYTLCFSGIVFSTNVFAEGPRMDPEKRVERMKEDLNLSDDQATRIREIFANQTGKQDCRNVENDDDRMQCRLD